MKMSSEKLPAKVNPKNTPRAAAFELWMNAPNPMVTFFKTLDVTPLVRMSKKRGMKFNMLLCWCIGKAASGIEEFYLLPVGHDLVQYGSIAVNTIVKNNRGEISSCDVPFSTEIARFNADYLNLTRAAAQTCTDNDITDSMVIGTSAIVETELDGAVGMNSGIFNNPFLIWGRYRRSFFRCKLTVSFQFHHTQMDGAHAGEFLAELQRTIAELR
jgi:chloramphenicol O-acetyltransferase type A